MRPKIQAIDEQLILRIITEAKQILAEVGIEVRGHKLKERLLAHGLPTDETGKRILFPAAAVEAALATAPRIPGLAVFPRRGRARRPRFRRGRRRFPAAALAPGAR